MNVSVIRAADLTSEHVKTWSCIQSANSCYESPFFRPEFTLAFGKENANAFVGIIRNVTGGIAGFFPFQVSHPGNGSGLDMCDHQGIIAASAHEICAEDVVRRCGLKSWCFDHLSVSNPGFRKSYSQTHASPIIDISKGYDLYKDSLNSDGKRHLAKASTSARKVMRDLGPLRLDCKVTDSEVMQTMHRWREQKYGPLPGWSRRVLENIRTTSTLEFEGLLSALYAGDRLLAVHFGMRSRGVLHWWFPAYDRDLPSYAPGILLLLSMAERGTELGISKIDLGKGIQDYKRRFSNASVMVASGSVDPVSLTNMPRIVRRKCLAFVRNSPVIRDFIRRVKLRRPISR
jgi:CelD/BcsL family acetyltransferase involved in cellulose biosynthesis